MASRELIRYLKQRLEAGERTLFLDGLTANEALTLVAGRQAGVRPAAAPSADPVAGGAGEPVPGGHRERGAGGATPPRGRPGSEVGGGPPPVPAMAGGPVAATPEAGASPQARAVSPEALEGLRVLAHEASGCTRCGLHETRRNVVFGEGDATADLVVVGEAPGFYEDQSGRPFVGRAGRLLDLLLMSAGFPREKTYICNVLKCRPPENRDPAPNEVACCSPFLHGQLERIAPRVLLAVGTFAARTLLETDESIGALRGRVHSYRGIPLVASYHPAYVLRNPRSARAAWRDLQLVRRVADGSVLAAAPAGAHT